MALQVLNGSLDFEESREQTLLIANFPPHRVTRMPSWEWLVENENVVIWSVDDSQDITSPTHPPATAPWVDSGGPGELPPQP